MVKQVTMYTVICDNCGCDSNAGQEYSCWGEPDHAENQAADLGFVKIEGKDYCEDCVHYNDKDQLVVDQSRTKQPI